MFLHTSEINLNKMEIILFQATNIIPFPLNNSGHFNKRTWTFWLYRNNNHPSHPPISHALNLYAPVYILLSKKALPVDFTLRPSISKSISKFWTIIILKLIFTKDIHQTLDLIPTARPVQIIGRAAQGVVKVAVEGSSSLFITKWYTRFCEIQNMAPSMLSQSPLEGLHFQVFVQKIQSSWLKRGMSQT